MDAGQPDFHTCKPGSWKGDSPTNEEEPPAAVVALRLCTKT